MTVLRCALPKVVHSKLFIVVNISRLGVLRLNTCGWVARAQGNMGILSAKDGLFRRVCVH